MADSTAPNAQANPENDPDHSGQDRDPNEELGSMEDFEFEWFHQKVEPLPEIKPVEKVSNGSARSDDPVPEYIVIPEEEQVDELESGPSKPPSKVDKLALGTRLPHAVAYYPAKPTFPSNELPEGKELERAKMELRRITAESLDRYKAPGEVNLTRYEQKRVRLEQLDRILLGFQQRRSET